MSSDIRYITVNHPEKLICQIHFFKFGIPITHKNVQKVRSLLAKLVYNVSRQEKTIETFSLSLQKLLSTFMSGTDICQQRPL